jgi:hypothetical protein
MNSQISPVQIVLPIAILAGLVIAFFFGINIAHGDYTQMTLLAIGACLVAWSMIGRRIWWLPIFFFACLGGHFYFGFKIYAHELAVIICLLPLIITLAMKRDHFKDRHFPVPMVIIFLFLYLCLHFLTCFVYNKSEGPVGLGNITRRYMDAIWPFLIFIPYLLVGNSKYIPWVLHLVAGATLIRFGLGMYTVLFADEDTILFIPVINFVPAGGFGVGDLRASGSTLVTVAICYFCVYRSFLLRYLIFLPVILIGIWGTFLGGGRITIALLMGLFGFLFLLYRQYGLLLITAIAMSIAIVVINAEPALLYQMPNTARRAATAFLLDRNLAADTGETRSSDEWHARLITEGWKSWTENGMTILFGRGVKQFESNAWMEGKNFEGMIDMAIQTSRFEKGLWDVLCTFGIVGLALYSVLLLKIMQYCTPILFSEKIRTPIHAIMFIAVYQCLTWFLLCWMAGSFPSTVILFGIVAMVAAHDMMNQREKGTERLTIGKQALAGKPAEGSSQGDMIGSEGVNPKH